MATHANKRVLVLERHYTAGGFTHVFKRKGFEWDVGVHYIGEVHDERAEVRRVFDDITDGQLKWADMGEVYDRIIIGEDQYDLVKGRQNFIKKLTEYFPEEEDNIKEYVRRVKETVRNGKLFFLDKACRVQSAQLRDLYCGEKRCKPRDKPLEKSLQKLPITSDFKPF